MKRAAGAGIVLTLSMAAVACSGVVTYIRHEENTGNIQCSGDAGSHSGIKRDNSVCNATSNQSERPDGPER